MGIWAFAKKIWPSGVSPKRALKMQLRDVVLRSVRTLYSKVMAKNFFPQKMPCILPYKAENIKSMFSRQVRDLTQKAKVPKV